MKPWFPFPILILALVLGFPGVGSMKENGPDYFKGGDSDISSSDPERGPKAIRKWTDPQGRQGDVLLKNAPFFWDSSRVGRPVFIRILKNSHREGLLEIWLENPAARKFEPFKTYQIKNFSGDLGPKTREGDFQAPEGFYFVSRRRLNPQSRYHLSMDIGYPNEFDRMKNWTGSLIMIHGSWPSVGCFAMTDCSIEQIYTLVDRALNRGQSLVRVHVFPFAMTNENLEAQRENPHYDFWKNLKQGWDWFETHRRPPQVTVRDGRYHFADS